jgi:hypothetical protein
MAATTLKPTINIKSSFTTIGAGFTKANKSVGSMKNVLLKKTKVKRDAIAGRKSLFGKRIENQRRKDEEAVIEASKPNTISKIGNSVLNSGKGLLDRIIDFAGTLLVGWLVNNLPTIMTMAQDLIGRIQRTVNILGNFMKDIGAIFTGSTKVFGAVLTNIKTLDFFDSNKRLDKALGELEDVFGDMNKQFDDGLKTLTTPLGQMPGEQPVPPTGTDYTTQPGASSVSGSSKEALNVIAKYESTSAGGYEAVNQIGIKGGTATLPGSYSGPFGGMQQHKGKKLTQMTVGEIMELQKEKSGMSNAEWVRQGRLHAVGRYQIIGPTLAGLVKRGVIKTSDKFDETTQDVAAMSLLKSGGIGQWVGPSRYASAKEKATIEAGRKSNIQFSSVVPSAVAASQPSSGKVIQYITGDRTSPRYAADHAGGNYHDHIGFDSPKTRDAAMAFLVSKGWTIGSINTGKHVRGSLHYKNLAFDIPFYPNQSRKGVPDNAKGETALSSRLRADLIAGGFSGPQLGGGSGGGGTSVASVPPNPPNLPSTRRAPQVMVMDNRPEPQPQQRQVASGGAAPPPMIDSENVLNNLMRNYLLLDLAYT